MTKGERLAILAHELRSPVAALSALAAAGRNAPASGLTRIAELATTAGRDIERLLSDLDVLSLRMEDVDLGTLFDPLTQLGVTCSVESARVVCDPTRIRQALANLVANGLRHGTAVSVTAHRRGDRVVVDVTDDGPGIPAGMDVFARGVSGVGSSGYGLWLAREIAQAHGGTLTLESGSAGGATFTLDVPSPPVASG
jgi:signal transduction histidine kinase